MSIENFKARIDDHRREQHITCEESCWCWDAEEVLVENEALRERLKPVVECYEKWNKQNGTYGNTEDFNEHYRELGELAKDLWQAIKKAGGGE
jgi:hypothetical protein